MGSVRTQTGSEVLIMGWAGVLGRDGVDGELEGSFAREPRRDLLEEVD